MDYVVNLIKYFFGYDELSDNGVPEGPHKIVAFGNVLIDRTVKLEDTGILDKFHLSLNSKGELDMQTLTEITAAVGEKLEPKFQLGGCALNSVRILKHLGTNATFFGAIGADESGKQLSQYLQQYGVDARLQIVEDTLTGSAICLVHGKSTCLYANIGASAKFSCEHLKLEEKRDPNFLRPSARRQIFYIESFFIPHRETVCQYILDHYIEGRRMLALNLSGSYIVKQKFENVLNMAKKAYFLFGNEDEFEALSEQLGCDKSSDLVEKIFEEGVNKIVIITKGAEGVQLISNYIDEHAPPGPIIYDSFKAPYVANVVDTTGAGDAFVAGFFHAWLERRPLTECIRMAMDVAARVVTVVGCYLPEMIEN